MKAATTLEIWAERERRRTELAREATSRNADVIKKRCKRLAGFVREAWHVLEPETEYVHGWHIDYICEHLEAIIDGRLIGLGCLNRLDINVPPGTMKSLLTSVFFPAWVWGPCRMAGKRIISTSYSLDFVKRDSRRMRDLIVSEWYQQLWGDRVKLVRAGELSFENTMRGWREGMPFDSLTGGRADIVIIDDPLSVKTAASNADRSETIRIFRSSAQNRLVEPKISAIIHVAQRLHPSDCSGVAEELKLGYVKVMLPMEFEPERRCVSPLKVRSPDGKSWVHMQDPRTDDGELLFPTRFPREVVERDKKSMGAQEAAGQLQQRPSPRGGLLFKRHHFGFVRAAPVGTKWVRGYDLAATEAKTKDTTTGPAFTSGVKIGRGPDGIFYIAHVLRMRESGFAVKAAIKATAIQDGTMCEIDLPQDPGQAGKAQAQDMVAFLAGYLAYASPETGDKATRASPLAVQAEAGNVKLVVPDENHKPDWVEPFLDEIETFPGSKYKDQVDAASRGFARLTRVAAVPMVGAIVVSGGARNFPG